MSSYLMRASFKSFILALHLTNRKLRMIIKYAVNFKFHYKLRIEVPNMYVHFCRDVYDFRNVVWETEKTIRTE